MYNNIKKRNEKRVKRVFRVRKKLKGSDDKPRLTLFKSNKHLYAQLINDDTGKTIVGFGTLSKELKGSPNSKLSKQSAKFIGEKIAEIAKGKNIAKIVFDRGRFKFHGIVAEFAEGARSGGLQF